MVLQNHWVVSCNYNGEIYGVELKPGKKPDLRIPELSKEKTAVVHYTILDKGKAKNYNQKLYNNVKRLITKRLKTKYKTSWFEETGAIHQIQFSIMKDKVSMLIDTSGMGLHKRGYRLEANGAPIKETLAAAMAELARLRHYHTLYDVTCGSGTILIEGAMKALNIAPGLKRSFISERFENIDSSVWQQERMRATDAVIQDADFMAYGSDIDFRALEVARENARRAGVGMKIDLSKRDVKDFTRKSEKGTVICNPPFDNAMGHRIFLSEILITTFAIQVFYDYFAFKFVTILCHTKTDLLQLDFLV